MRRIDPDWSLEETGTSIQAAAAGPRDDSRLSDCCQCLGGGYNPLNQTARKTRLHPEQPKSCGPLNTVVLRNAEVAVFIRKREDYNSKCQVAFAT